MSFIPADEDDFFLRVAEALSGCQLVEQELKLYITEAFDLVRKCLKDQLPFKMSGDDYQDSSLERLIGIFQKLSNNASLYERLNQFKVERNFLSHKAITHCMDPDCGLSLPAVIELEPRLAAIAEEARALQRAIHEEANKFTGSLWFDDVDHAG
jgi:hypothetical protein